MVEVSPLIGRTSRISASAFTGRAVAPAQPDPVTTGLINKNSLQLAVVSNQIQGMSAQMNSLAGSLQVIASSLSTSQALERRKEQQEQIIEQRLAQQQLREGKESTIEKKIQAAAIAPAQKLAGTAQFTLSRLNSFFMSLLGGWLLTKGVETIKALSENNKEKLIEIKNHVLATLGVLGAVFIGGKLGIALIAKSFSRIGLRFLAAAAAGLFARPFLQLFDILKKVTIQGLKQAPVVGSLFQNLGNDNTNNTNNDDTVDVDSTKPPGENDPQPNNPNLEGKGGPSLGPSLVTPTQTMMGDTVDPKLQELKNERAGIRQEYFLNRISKEEYKSQTAELDKQINEFGSTNQAEVTAQPQETALGKPAEGENKKGAELDPATPAKYGETSLKAEEVSGVEKKEQGSTDGDLSKGIDKAKLFGGEKAFLEMGFNVNQATLSGVEKYVENFKNLPADMFTPVKKDADIAKRVGPEPEQQINIVPIPTGTQDSAPPQQSQPAATGGINNAPSYATSNRDNIYILGAMSNFNVVMA